jgi:hypothetical protein
MPVQPRSMAVAGGGRFVPPTPSIVKHAAGQFRITNLDNRFLYPIVATSGPVATRSSDILTLSQNTSESRVRSGAPKGITTSPEVNIKRTPYTFFGHNNAQIFCSAHHSDGQCAGWGSHNNWSGPFKNSTPAQHSDSNNEWWRIW